MRALKFPGGPPRKAFRSEAMVVQIWPDRFPWGGVGVTSCRRKKGEGSGRSEKLFFRKSFEISGKMDDTLAIKADQELYVRP